MLMEREILTLKKGVDYALSKMLMDISGRDLVKICKSTTFHHIE
jgi:hypothetical protein